MGDVLAWAAKKTIGEFGGYSKEISFVQRYIGIIYEPHSGSKKNRQVDVIISNKTKEVKQHVSNDVFRSRLMGAQASRTVC